MRVVLHICCGVCAAGAAERLTQEGHELLGIFYNPNIYPREEYERRLEAASAVAGQMRFPIEVPPYRPEEWFDVAGGMAGEPEGGHRCDVCYRLRLGKTALFTGEIGYEAFTTTLTIGPRKHADVINRIGRDIAGERFLARDFKKKDGFKHAIDMAKRLDLYRQDYCGCVYSLATSSRPGSQL
jgi:predicted adenine nucleotide alpha hydrolase (AANH) superfamily ATPase